jgi:hypothetical protein
VAQAIAEATDITTEKIDSLQREVVEEAVGRMFAWRVGEFSFDVRDEAEAEDPPVFVPAGINAQYLAMECSRIDDEAGRDDGADSDEGPELSAHEMFGVSPDEPADPSSAAVETIAVSALAATDPFAGSEPTDPASEPEPVPVAEVEPIEDHAEEPGSGWISAEPVVEAEPLPAAETDDDLAVAEPIDDPAGGAPAVEREPATSDPRPPLVVIGPELPVLEWVKECVPDDQAPVHIFQRSDLGLNRIRQYLVRGTLPLVLVAPETPGDPLSGIPDATDFVRRLKGQAQRMTVLWLDAADATPSASVRPADGRVARPAAYQINNAGAAQQREELAQRLRDALASAARDGWAERSAADAMSAAALAHLKAATAHLREASSRGEVLPLVIRFAGESFSRTAMFAVLDGTLMGMAGRGLERAGGPDDEGLRQIRMEAIDSGWVSRVLETRAAIRGGPINDGDRALASVLGDRTPTEAYLAPIESAGQVVALLYGDNLPGERPLPDTSALEVVLHHAGLALDRAALERALAEAER